MTTSEMQPGVHDTLPGDNPEPAVTHTTLSAAAIAAQPHNPTQPPPAPSGKPPTLPKGPPAKATPKPPAKPVKTATGLAEPTEEEEAAQEAQKPLGGGVFNEVVPAAEETIWPGEEVVYWDLPKKHIGARDVYGWDTNLTPRYARIAEVSPAVWLTVLVPGAWLHLSTEEAHVPTVGKFTRFSKAAPAEPVVAAPVKKKK